jgi:ABC-type enterochelin transport system permease subunit
MTHLTYTLLLSFLLSGAAALPGDRSGRERVYAATYVFLTCVVSIVGGGWFMYLVHR